MSRDLAPFLAPAPGIVSDDPAMVALARRATGDARTPDEAAARLFALARDRVAYDMLAPFDALDDFLAPATLARGRGFCMHKAALLCTLARAAGIPARLGLVDIRNHLLPEELLGLAPDRTLRGHCYVEWWLGGRWLVATPDFERELCARKGWRLVEFAPGRDALLPASDLAGRPHVEYLAHHGWHLGVPLAQFRHLNREFITPEALARWRERAA